LFLDYLGKAYSSYLSGEDNFTALEESLARNLEAKSQSLLNEVNEITHAVDALRNEIETLKNSPVCYLKKQFERKRKSFLTNVQNLGFRIVLKNFKRNSRIFAVMNRNLKLTLQNMKTTRLHSRRKSPI
jgi:SMC interacting uncharacterized protein involved in chromosome segregation